MRRGDSLIYSGRMQAAGLLGDPGLLRKEGNGYVAGDIKSGSGEEGAEDHSRPKKHYAVQLALYTDILERKGLSASRRTFVWDINVFTRLWPASVRHPSLCLGRTSSQTACSTRSASDASRWAVIPYKPAGSHVGCLSARWQAVVAGPGRFVSRCLHQTLEATRLRP